MLTVTKGNRNFGLTEEQFDRLVNDLRLGDETLFETIFLRQFGACMDWLKKKYKVPHEDAYDSVMWAMLRMRQCLLENKVTYGNLESYMLRMAANNFLKKQSRSREIPTEHLPESIAEEEPVFDDEMLRMLDTAWTKLGEKCQLLLKGFYYDKLELKHLSALLGDTSEANTRKRKERCLSGLRKLFFESC